MNGLVHTSRRESSVATARRACELRIYQELDNQLLRFSGTGSRQTAGQRRPQIGVLTLMLRWQTAVPRLNVKPRAGGLILTVNSLRPTPKLNARALIGDKRLNR